jgi:diaminopimelate epimerase
VLRFAKYHGLGNDFVVVDGRELAAPLAPARIRQLCDRHRGIGADGVLTVWPATAADARMQVQNADGSESGMCGNGLRCVARYLYETGRVPLAQAMLTIEAGAETYRCERLAEGRFRVAMGRAAVAHPDLPGPEVTLDSGGERFRAACAHVGNPHAVIFLEAGEPVALAERHGPALERHPAFPNRVNVSFVRARADGFDVAVFERGVGLTLACGSGAAAVAAVAVREQRWAAGEPMAIELPGGRLTVVVDPNGTIQMTGEAVRVFTGEVGAT